MAELTKGETEALARCMGKKPTNSPTKKKTTRRYSCGCKVFTFKPQLEWKWCNRHRWDIEFECRTYEAALKFIEKLGDFEMVYPPKRRR